MKRVFFLCVLAALISAGAEAAPLDMKGFQTDDGAIVVSYKGDTVDPYFATLALLLAGNAGFDTAAPAQKWVQWLMARQQKDGLFQRYRRSGQNAAWEPYAGTDADDAMLALWMELLYQQGLKTSREQASEGLAEADLQMLYDPASGIYHISKELPIGLYMDNVEIHAAFASISRQLSRRGQNDQAGQYAATAARLKDHIHAVFWDTGRKEFRVSTQKGAQADRFYPGKVAQIFSLLYGRPAESSVSAYQSWMRQNEGAWLNMAHTDYPWGLIAIVALRMGDADSAFCWEAKSEPFRYGPHWNVLEEISLQIVKKKLSVNPPHAKIACAGDPV